MEHRGIDTHQLETSRYTIGRVLDNSDNNNVDDDDNKRPTNDQTEPPAFVFDRSLVIDLETAFLRRSLCQPVSTLERLGKWARWQLIRWDGWID